MAYLGIFVGENWDHFQEIYETLTHHYTTELYTRKTYNVPLLHGTLNRFAFRESVRAMLRRNRVCFFEYASDFLMHASHMPKRCAIITRLHSFELYRWAPKINWEAVDRVILVSHAMQERFAELYPAHHQKTVVVYNGRSLQEFKPPVQKTFRFNLGMLCNISPIKRIYEVILMFYNLRQQGYDSRLYIAGRPSDLRYMAAIDRLVKKLDLHDTVLFDGYVTNPAAWLQKIDIFISNSYWEGQQVALLEAMASGCYSLSHNWAGAEEMLPPENLYLTEGELQQKILDYAAMPAAEKCQCQTRLRTIACEKFNIMETKAQIRQIIEEEAHKLASSNR